MRVIKILWHNIFLKASVSYYRQWPIFHKIDTNKADRGMNIRNVHSLAVLKTQVSHTYKKTGAGRIFKETELSASVQGSVSS